MMTNILEISNPCFFSSFSSEHHPQKHLRANCPPYNNLSCHIQTPRDITVPGTRFYIYSSMCAITHRPISFHCPMKKGNWYMTSSFPGPRSGFDIGCICRSLPFCPFFNTNNHILIQFDNHVTYEICKLNIYPLILQSLRNHFVRGKKRNQMPIWSNNWHWMKSGTIKDTHHFNISKSSTNN